MEGPDIEAGCASAPPSFTSQASDKECDHPSGGSRPSESTTSAAQPQKDHAEAGPSQDPPPLMPFMLKRGLLRYEATYGTLARSSPQGPLECRICLQTDKAEELLAPCACRGSMQFVHPACLLTWATSKASPACELCSADFALQEDVKQQLDEAIKAAVRQKESLAVELAANAARLRRRRMMFQLWTGIAMAVIVAGLMMLVVVFAVKK